MYGSKVKMREAVSTGKRIKYFSDDIDNGFGAESDDCLLVGPLQIACQLIGGVFRASWDRFDTVAKWEAFHLSTSGHNFRLKENPNARIVITNRRRGTWYVAQNTCDRPSGEAVYSAYSNGTVISGSWGNLVQAALSGASLRVVDSSLGRVDRRVYINNLEVGASGSLESRALSGQSLWRLNQTRIRAFYDFTLDPSWLFETFSANGNRGRHEWFLNDHISAGITLDTVELAWYADTCWTEVYSHDSSGSQVSGSLAELVQAIEDGHRVKVMFENMFMEVDNCRVIEGHVSAQLVSRVSKSDISSIEANTSWAFVILNTKGTVKTYTLLVSDSSTPAPGFSNVTLAITWYVDTRTWVQLMATDASGNIISGSKTMIRDAVTSGADLRVGIKIPVDTVPGQQFLKVDNVRLYSSDDTSGQSVRALNEVYLGSSEVELDAIPFWSFRIMATTGTVSTIGATVGKLQETRNSQFDPSEMVWFGSY